jgi:hypothetical protein
MISDFRKQLFLGVAVAGLALMISGCACKPGKPGKVGRYDIQVGLDDALKQASVLVDLVGVNQNSLDRWSGYSMTQYWKGDDPSQMRAGAVKDRVTLSFRPGGPLSQTLAATNTIWKHWAEASVTHVLVLADLPGAPADRPGAEDPRRQILPLDQCYWIKKTKSLDVRVKLSGIDVLTSPRFPKTP